MSNEAAGVTVPTCTLAAACMPIYLVLNTVTLKQEMLPDVKARLLLVQLSSMYTVSDPSDPASTNHTTPSA